ncbi:hypothetical protein, partial [Staphylococcus epidermidis]|uniref:hypothetical protein n=1 Tax=Staphylococcus epidermidis TaxID=1282 RepID=UPI001C92E321
TLYSGQTFKNTINLNHNYPLNTLPSTTHTAITITTNNNHLLRQAPNLTNTTNKILKLKPTHKTPNQTIVSFTLNIKPLNHKYTITTSSTNQTPLTITNIQNNPNLSIEHQNTLKS